MSRPTPRVFTVLDKTLITPHMLRVTLGGDGMVTFPEDQAGTYIKLMFTRNDGTSLMRTYTVRAQRKDAIDVDLVLHEDGGPAAQWVEQAVPGDTLEIGGPGPRKRVDQTADWYLLAGDMTALPAISDNLENLPAHARGHAVIEVLSEAEVQPLDKPDGIQLHWVINEHPGENSDVLINAVRGIYWQDGRPAVWAACEFSAMRRLRHYFKVEREVARSDLYISSYWKLGMNEERHKTAKREDAEQAG
ncbi:NADPH-dependent ferric siderophore reductase, contains FAD-binding and SIP domains [Kushneria avicenniae]|uniref:NADPH-dependent ferric siderophore reductase, contains FAD-binding and SIP domains n=1 Tax=Kushneria avicenniae TaxID=402385 RepID=A0A1I1JNT0_9GAMM|nr:siderophore-interacting protein [Kushneria avicenniae]SFC50289.1 NADPH-dependent ferric siderophore reductase, contains FAD-binding and SIP domains [Kushneria avicenniae]